MGMRASQSEQTGGIGISDVTSAFQRLGWGPAINYQHDLGTDLFVQARDERLQDLRLIIGVQVKAGPSYFQEPVSSPDGELCGWWFRDGDRRHVDYWLSHSIPHLIVLHDLDSRVSSWVHVTEDAVVSTGVGAKILVRRANTIDADHREALLKVAGAGQPGVPWEGSVWMAGAAIPSPARLRHALVVPRLIAPHPNQGRQHPLTAEQAVAMLMQARLFELEQFAAEFPEVPRAAEAEERDDWTWRLFAALYARVTASATDRLLARVDDAPRPAMRAAAAVAAASALIEDGDANQAVELLDRALDGDDAEPVDHAWLLVHRARCRAEIGELTAARENAVAAQASRAAAPNDATASAVAASAAVLLFNTSTWGERNVEEVITGADTAASWWRAQTTSRGLDAIVERAFKDWARDTSITFGGEDVANNQLHAAALAASHSGDQAAWRYLSALGATNQLLRLDRHADPQTAADALTALRLAGDHQALGLAVRRLAQDGPARAVTIAAAEIDLDRSTRTTGHADLTLLQRGGHLVETETASRIIHWLLAAIADPTAFAERTSPSYLLGHQLVETLGGVANAGDHEAQQAIVGHLLGLPPVTDDFYATYCAQLVYALPDQAWDAAQAARAHETAGRHNDRLRIGLLRVAARHGDEPARAVLLEEAEAGSLDAAAALGDVRELPKPVVATQVAKLAASARETVTDAHAGKHGMGGDGSESLALLNVWHPEQADWVPLVELLDDGVVSADAKRGALRLLAMHTDRIPAATREKLVPAVTRIAKKQMPGFVMDQRDASAEAALLAAALGAPEIDPAEQVTALLAGGYADRRFAATLAGQSGSPEQAGLLAALAADDHPLVRAASCAALAKLANDTDAGRLVIDALHRCATDPGTQVPATLAAALQDIAAPLADALRERLLEHPSAAVRQRAAA